MLDRVLAPNGLEKWEIICLNPLHCGAVVASLAPNGLEKWEIICLNPLHCGAVVASAQRVDRHSPGVDVSIPFIAGQWSLLPALAPERAQRLEFQSPSLRGSGRFTGGGSPRRGGGAFQSPSLRGSGRFRTIPTSGQSDFPLFQSPSLRGSGRFFQAWTQSARSASSFNPLHCGAVVASRAPTSPSSLFSCFNPLHCGAVVASGGA